jgi:chromatin remodeling complex protein RSC6
MEAIITDLTNRIIILETKMLRQEKMMRKMKKDLIPECDRVPRKPSGFAKPAYLSPELCLFLDIPSGTELARTEVTKRLLNYVKENKCQSTENKRIIILDDKLHALLKPVEGEDVSYFNIQRLLKGHYHKPVAEEIPVVIDVAPEPVKKAVKKTKK